MPAVEFKQLLLHNAEYLKPFAITLTHDHEDAKDLFQETLYRAFVNKDRYGMGTNIKAWLYTIMRNIFINDYRKKTRYKTVFDGTSQDSLINSLKATTANDAIASLHMKEIQSVVINLPEIFNTPFLLYFEGYKYNEISGMLNEPLGTIKSRIHFARKLLKAQIERS